MSATPASQAICFTLPVLPGKTGTDREAMRSCWRGDRREDHAAARRRQGITRESVWIQSTPAGDVVVVLLEASDLAAALESVATSTDPFDEWFRDHVADVHGVKLDEGFDAPEQVLDYGA
jgi:hypothetical protein